VLLEPTPTPIDLHFRLAGIPVRIHPGFWIVGFILGFRSGDGLGPGDRPAVVLIFMAVLFVSILIHELGHAFAMRRFGYSPRVVLYHFGGLAIRDSENSSDYTRPRQDTTASVIISLAGPAAGFLFAAAVVLMLVVSGGSFAFAPTQIADGTLWRFKLPPDTQQSIWYLVYSLLFINIFWGLVNLAPVLPLDGGNVARALWLHRDRFNGMIRTVQLSIAVGIAMAAFFYLVMGETFAALFFALLALSNYLTLQQLGRNW
jgi:stage IV sporulation protein FB